MPKDKKPEYDALLKRNVYWGAHLAVVASLVFVVMYIWGGYPPVMVFANAFSLLLSLGTLVTVRLGYFHKVLAHILTFITYNAMLGAAVYSGGLASSSIVWLLVVPLISVLMMNRRGVTFWAAVSMATLIAFYVWNVPLTETALIPITPVDRLIDSVVALIVITIAVWVSESSRHHVLHQLENARAQLQRLAEIDPLTEVYNRRYFANHARRLLQTPGDVTFLTFDIDHFKKVNDKYGHATGDRVLQIVCQRVLHNLRDGDILARFGGEEFVILLPNTDAEVGLHVAERLRRAVAREPFLVGEAQLHITISIGITSHSGAVQDVDSFGELLQEADKAMYRAKQNGRNRVEFFSKADEAIP